MKRIIAFEIKQIFRNKLILGIVFIFSIINIYHIYDDYAKNIKKERTYYKAYFQLYHDVSGEWDTSKIEYVVSEYEKAKSIVDAGNFSTEPNQPNTYTGYIFGDYGLFEKIKNEMDTQYHYYSSMEEIAQRAADNTVFYQQKGNAYLTKVNQKIENTYQDRNISAFYDTFGLTKYLKYDFSTLLILVLIIPMLSPVFAREHEIEMYSLLKLTTNFKKLFASKLLAGAAAIFLVSFLFLVEDFLTFTFLYHINIIGLSQPIYALSDFYYSPLTVDIGTYILINATLKLLSFLIFGEICMVVSVLVKNEVIPFCFSFTITLILVLCDAFIDNSTVSIFNPVTLLSCGKMFKEFQVVRIFDTPVYTFYLPIIIAFSECLLLAVFTVLMGKFAPYRHSLIRRSKGEI